MKQRIPNLPIIGFIVHDVSSSSQLNIHLSTPDHVPTAVVRVSGSFALDRSSGGTITLQGDAYGGDRTPLGVCLNLYGSTLTSAQISPRGSLHLQFERGRLLATEPWTLEVEPGDDFEAWEVRVSASGTTSALHVIGTPGGSVAAFTT